MRKGPRHTLTLTPNVEVVIARLPERFFGAPLVRLLFQRLSGSGQGIALGLVYQQMDVIGHFDVSVDEEPVGLPNSLEC